VKQGGEAESCLKQLRSINLGVITLRARRNEVKPIELTTWQYRPQGGPKIVLSHY